jgi:transcriptional regulator with XRE-family HTH domain
VKKSTKAQEFGLHLRRLREEKGLSQQQLADLSDISKLTIQRIENAKFNASLPTIFLIAEALSIKPDKLFQF